MKTLRRLKLNKFNDKELEERKMRALMGGRIGTTCYCSCMCSYDTNMKADNGAANMTGDALGPEANGSYTIDKNQDICFEWDLNGEPSQSLSR